jgi:hypothetical protein
MPGGESGLTFRPPLLPGVERVDRYASAVERARDRNAAVLGSVALGGSVEVVPPGDTDTQTIKERIELSLHGDENARKALETDARTEVIEMICKGGAVMEVQASMNAQGELEQFGATTFNRQRNTLAYFPDQSPALRANTMAEGQNGFLIEQLWQQGALADKRVVEFSLILDNENRRTLADYGYYLQEMIGIIRMTDASERGDVTITSALVGGVAQDELSQLPETGDVATDEVNRQNAALASRFDIAVVRRLYELMGYDNAYELSTTELLATPLLVPKTMDALDFVQLYDQIAADITGKEVFFGLTDLAAAGQRRPGRAGYEDHAAQSLAFQKNLEATAARVTDEVLSKAAEATDALAASKLLRDVAKNHAVAWIIAYKHVDVRVFGSSAEELILSAQAAFAAGRTDEALELTTQAQKVARPSGCPLAKQAEAAAGTANGEDADDDPEDWEWSSGVCRISNCPTRPGATEVGPCAVCRDCQAIFDTGDDPTSRYAKAGNVEKSSKIDKHKQLAVI